MCQDRWDRSKGFWLLCKVQDEQLLCVVSHYAERYPFDHNTVLWLSSRGVKGDDVGGSLTEELAKTYGNYVPRNEAHDVCRCRSSDAG